VAPLVLCFLGVSPALGQTSGPALQTAAAQAVDTVPLPKSRPGYFLRVLYIENPKLETLADADLRKLLTVTQKVMAEHFGIVVIFKKVVRKEIKDYFPTLDRKIEKWRKGEMAGIRDGTVDWRRVEKAMGDALAQEDLDAVRAYYADTLGADVSAILPPGNADAMARSVTAAMRSRVGALRTLRDKNGGLVLDPRASNSDRYTNEWVYWDNLSRLNMPFEVVITNQLIASITAGSTMSGWRTAYGTLSWLSLYPFLSNAPPIRKLRGGAPYAAEEALTLAGAYLAHELGHQLFHLNHPWGNAACVMTPAPLLDFKKWYRTIDPAKCRIGSEPAMTPGVVNLPVLPRF